VLHNFLREPVKCYFLIVFSVDFLFAVENQRVSTLVEYFCPEDLSVILIAVAQSQSHKAVRSRIKPGT
jgi:hypothetical protein